MDPCGASSHLFVPLQERGVKENFSAETRVLNVEVWWTYKVWNHNMLGKTFQLSVVTLYVYIYIYIHIYIIYIYIYMIYIYIGLVLRVYSIQYTSKTAMSFGSRNTTPNLWLC